MIEVWIRESWLYTEIIVYPPCFSNNLTLRNVICILEYPNSKYHVRIASRAALIKRYRVENSFKRMFESRRVAQKKLFHWTFYGSLYRFLRRVVINSLNIRIVFAVRHFQSPQMVGFRVIAGYRASLRFSEFDLVSSYSLIRSWLFQSIVRVTHIKVKIRSQQHTNWSLCSSPFL